MLAATAYCTERGRGSERFRDDPDLHSLSRRTRDYLAKFRFILTGHAAALPNTGPPNLSIGCSRFRRANGPSNIFAGVLRSLGSWTSTKPCAMQRDCLQFRPIRLRS